VEKDTLFEFIADTQVIALKILFKQYILKFADDTKMFKEV